MLFNELSTSTQILVGLVFLRGVALTGAAPLRWPADKGIISRETKRQDASGDSEIMSELPSDDSLTTIISDLAGLATPTDSSIGNLGDVAVPTSISGSSTDSGIVINIPSSSNAKITIETNGGGCGCGDDGDDEYYDDEDDEDEDYDDGEGEGEGSAIWSRKALKNAVRASEASSSSSASSDGASASNATASDSSAGASATGSADGASSTSASTTGADSSSSTDTSILFDHWCNDRFRVRDIYRWKCN
ncbi:hypothetical protein C8R41DRAFT_564227 [Lentinula lateritia]|uniref:Uncharacterized protein n=1 Tax=Lentinula lateritia TaxID=40482 RepID=A0ABQ8VU33_9AGAR|nr:hypothetical protein C8R41DRAFT_564227 [Lentinula lateritia]